MAEKVGFIGLGIMGRPMAKNLMEAGYELVVHNRSPEKAEELAKEGNATAAASPGQVAQACDIVITMLPDSPDVEAVVAGEGGVLEGIRDGALLVDMSTISPVVTKELSEKVREKGASMLDAPVSGGDVGAIEGALSIMVGGSEEDFERARPLFDVMGKAATHVGPIGAGQVVKACNQIVVALTIEAVSEALVLGSKAGVRPEIILQVLGGGLAQSRVMEMRGPTMIQGKFEPGFKARLHRKDLNIALQTARQYGVSLPATALVDQLFTTLAERGMGDRDHSALLTVIEELANHRISS